jgi:hypothetical protein
VYTDAKEFEKDSDAGASKAELNFFLASMEEWSDVTATVKNKPKGELDTFVERSYKQLIRGGLVFGEQELHAALVESRETAMAIHKTESTLTAKTPRRRC